MVDVPGQTGSIREPSSTNASTVRYALAAAIMVGAALSILHLVLLLDEARFSNSIPLLAGLLLGVAAADLVAGGVHWACDTWGDETTPAVGPGLIRFFREHHHQPHKILEHDWIEVNGEACTAATAFFLLLWVPAIRATLAGDVFAHAFLWALASLAAGANQFHKWAHMRRPPALVGLFQNTGLILSLDRHAPHHRTPHTDGYCISTGWLNLPLDGIGFWRGLERFVTLLTGAEPRADSHVPGSRGHIQLRENE